MLYVGERNDITPVPACYTVTVLKFFSSKGE